MSNGFFSGPSTVVFRRLSRLGCLADFFVTWLFPRIPDPDAFCTDEKELVRSILRPRSSRSSFAAAAFKSSSLAMAESKDVMTKPSGSEKEALLSAGVSILLLFRLLPRRSLSLPARSRVDFRFPSPVSIVPVCRKPSRRDCFRLSVCFSRVLRSCAIFGKVGRTFGSASQHCSMRLCTGVLVENDGRRCSSHMNCMSWRDGTASNGVFRSSSPHKMYANPYTSTFFV
mmetsp:Transcript_12460/g.35194  ORF Transcript_12460/g.35194 Transcript_12460/m.35194 type:complete len:228 (-) Transcript_12460:569-1252(-)